jgi:hypothetical protein
VEAARTVHHRLAPLRKIAGELGYSVLGGHVASTWSDIPARSHDRSPSRADYFYRLYQVKYGRAETWHIRTLVEAQEMAANHYKPERRCQRCEKRDHLISEKKPPVLVGYSDLDIPMV